MAQNSIAVNCPAGVWTLVAENVVQGTIYRRNTRPVYIQDLRVAGDPAPTDDSNAAPIFAGDAISESIGSDAPVDVYIKATRYDGEVVVHL